MTPSEQRSLTLIPDGVQRQAAAYLADELDAVMSVYTSVRADRDVVLPGGVVAVIAWTFPLGWCIAHVLVTEPVAAATLAGWETACAAEGIDLVLWTLDGLGMQSVIAWSALRYGSAYLLRSNPRGAAPFALVRARQRGDVRDPWDRRGARDHLAWRTWRTAFVRCFEVEHTLSAQGFEHAVAGRPALQSYSDELLTDARRVSPHDGQPLLQTDLDDAWTVRIPDLLFPDVPRLPQSGCDAVRRNAADAGQATTAAPPEQPSQDIPAAVLPSTAVSYQEQYFATRLVARWAVFFDALEIPWSYHGMQLLGNVPAPDFWLPAHNCFLLVRHLPPKAAATDAAARLAQTSGVAVAMLTGQVGLKAHGHFWLPGLDHLHTYGNARFAGCGHCGALAITCTIDDATMLVRCSRHACRAAHSPSAANIEDYSPRLRHASDVAQAARFPAR